MLMEESTTYQEILEKGLSQGLSKGRSLGQQHMLIRQGTKRFGSPPATVVVALNAITDPEQLEVIGERLLDASGWDDLLKAE